MADEPAPAPAEPPIPEEGAAPQTAPATSKPGTSKKSSRAASRSTLSKSSSSKLASKTSLRGGASEASLSAKRARSKASVRVGGNVSEGEGAGLAAGGIEEDASAENNTATTSAPPPGILPLFLTSMTQDLFKVRTGEDVTAEKPIKMIPKADILSDLQSRLAIGDFYPAKQAILDFPGEELLLHYDAEFKYGQNFFLCITPEAMGAILRPAMEDKPTTAVVEIKRPVSKKWESYGSEKEVEENWVVKNRELMTVRVSRRRRNFSSQSKLGDRDAHDSFLECKPYKDPTYDISRMEISEGVQAVPSTTDAVVQTTWFRPLNFAVQYEPETMAPEEQEAVMSSREVEEFMEEVIIRFEKAIQQNSIVDIFQDDYQELGEEDATLEQGPHTTLQEYQSFTDLKHSKDRSIACVDWHPNIRGVVAVSCTERIAFDERVERGLLLRSRRSLILVWSFHDPIHPQLILEAPEDVQCFQFNPYDSNIIAGGCVNGQIVLWDITEHQDKLKINRKPGREGEEAASKDEREKVAETPVVHWSAVSSIEFSHRSAITDIQWLPKSMELSHNGELIDKGDNGHREVVATSLDGQVSFWDTRFKKDHKALDLVWRPFLRVPLSAMDNTFDYSLTKISIRRAQADKSANGPEAAPAAEKADIGDKAEAFSSKFFCATEEGDLIYSDWLADKAGEEKASRVEHAASYHFGSMSDLHRSPFFPDILLSVGGWSFHVWKEGVTAGPLLSSAPSSVYVICGRWSPTRPGVFYISKSDGTIEVWDLLDRSHTASSIQNISGTAISFMSIRQYPGKSLTHNQFIAAGDDEGTLHILEVPRNLIKPSKNERAFVRSFFERETRRLTYVRGRKEFRAKERTNFEQTTLLAAVKGGVLPPGSAGGARAASAGGRPPVPGPPPMSEDDEEKVEREYRKMEHNFLELEGLLPPEPLVV